jgi:uncharacterized protein YjbI with pentapeptide repeats
MKESLSQNKWKFMTFGLLGFILLGAILPQANAATDISQLTQQILNIVKSTVYGNQAIKTAVDTKASQTSVDNLANLAGGIKNSALTQSQFKILKCNGPLRDWVNLSECDLTGLNAGLANLRHANFTMAHLSLANFGQAHVEFAKLDHLEASESIFEDSHAASVSMVDSYFGNSNFGGADLRGAHMNDGLFTSSDFHDADLSHADLRNAGFQNADLDNTNLDGAVITGANFIDCTGTPTGTPAQGASLPDCD